MVYIIGIGANIGFTLDNIHIAINLISKLENTLIVSKASLYSSKALLKENSPKEWDIIYLNTAIKIQTNLEPFEFLKELKNIEKSIGRDLNAPIWSQRLIDLDILSAENLFIDTDKLTIPHKELLNRNFALAPLLELVGNWTHPKIKSLDLNKKLSELEPITRLKQTLSNTMRMGIVNLSEQSFSDGNFDDTQRKSNLFELIENGAEIIDIGAESTKPNAKAATSKIETQRLDSFLTYIKQNIHKLDFRPLISIDTRKLEVMQNILDKHSDIIWMINDVECNDIKQKAKLIAKYNKKYVITHNLGIIDRNEYLDKENAIGEICSFIKAKRDVLVKNGVNQNNIYFDVGFGFGKKAETAIYLLDNIEIIKNQLGLKTLVGHSRKASVLGLDKNSSISKLDNATKELSKKLQYQNIEIIRIHRI